jgi:hypothetical protein
VDCGLAGSGGSGAAGGVTALREQRSGFEPCRKCRNFPQPRVELSPQRHGDTEKYVQEDFLCDSVPPWWAVGFHPSKTARGGAPSVGMGAAKVGPAPQRTLRTRIYTPFGYTTQVLDLKSPFTHLSAVPRSGVGPLCKLMNATTRPRLCSGEKSLGFFLASTHY